MLLNACWEANPGTSDKIPAPANNECPHNFHFWDLHKCEGYPDYINNRCNDFFGKHIASGVDMLGKNKFLDIFFGQVLERIGTHNGRYND